MLLLHFNFDRLSMQVHRDLLSFSAHSPVITIGIFDGVHAGHGFIINRLKNAASENNGSSVILTLWPHPRLVLDRQPGDIKLLNSLDEKIILLKESGIDHLVILEFTEQLSQLSSCDFVKQVLVDQLGISHLIVGFNHRFGKDREGDISKLEECASRYSFTIEHLPPFNDGEQQLSSSLIRDLLSAGKIARANELLDYEYFIRGVVTTGSKLGRTLGFPTANILIGDQNKLIPRDGVYAVHVSFRGKLLKGMMNIGIRPTVSSRKDSKTLEVNIFDFNEDIYQEEISISFLSRMRDEMKFENTGSLKEQLIRDRETALELFRKYNSRQPNTLK